MIVTIRLIFYSILLNKQNLPDPLFAFIPRVMLLKSLRFDPKMHRFILNYIPLYIYYFFFFFNI
jgi:hypothetical protein